MKLGVLMTVGVLMVTTAIGQSATPTTDSASTRAARYTERGTELQRTNRYGQAVEWFHKAVLLLPKDAKAHFNYGWALDNEYTTRKNNSDGTISFSMSADPIVLGGLLPSRNKQQALSEYEEAVKLAPAVPMYRDQLGLALWSAHRYDDAILQYKAELSLLSTQQQLARRQAFSSLGGICFEVRKYDLAVEYYSKCVKVSAPGQGTYSESADHFELANASMKSGRPADAYAEWRKTIEIDPEGNYASEAKQNLKDAGVSSDEAPANSTSVTK